LKRLRHLIEKENVDAVVGIMGPTVSAQMRNLLEETETCLIVTDGGADIVRPADQSPYVFHNSLGGWQASWGTGTWAGRNIGPRAVVASSFYESGYDAPYAFGLGLEQAGGHVAETLVSGLPTDSDDLSQVIEGIKNAAPDFVYALYSGKPAVEFVKAYASAGLAGQIPLLASGFMVDESILPSLGKAAVGIKSCLPWAVGLQTSANQAFVKACRQATGRVPGPFAVLGYDAAQWLAASRPAGNGRAGLQERLAVAEFASPRGALRVDPASGCSETPLYLREVQSRNGGPTNEVVATLESVSASDSRVGPLRTAMKTGWLDPYVLA